MTDFRSTQTGLEVWVVNPSKAQASQTGLEAWVSQPVSFLASQVGIELWQSIGVLSRQFVITQNGLEVWIPGPAIGALQRPPFFWIVE
jgi:hypothetical protein